MAARKAGHRKVSVIDNPFKISKRSANHPKRRDDVAKLIKFTDDGIASRNITFCGPYGRRKVSYCDYAENGRCLSFIEDYLGREVVPFCGDTFSSTNITSIQSTFFRQESEDIFRRCLNATDEDRLIFVPRGRSPLEQLVQILSIQESTVVFVSSCAREESIAPWRATSSKIVRIAETKEGVLDLDDLEAQLLAHQGWGQLIGCFTAASHVTGLLADDVATTLLLHQHEALAFWDFTHAAPYIELDMNPTLLEASPVHKDALFFTVNKFLGGAMTPSVLVLKKKLVENGSVISREIDALKDMSCADVVDCARAGLVMQLKESIGNPAIIAKQEKITRTALTHMKTIPELLLLGNSSTVQRLPIFSFVVRHPRGAYLHHNFISAVLNDVFGIQALSYRADVYATNLLGIGPNLAEEFNLVIQKEKRSSVSISSQEHLRPGYTQICLPYTISDSELAFILEAVKMAATEAWKLLPQYMLNAETGEWRHYSNAVMKDRKILNSVRFVDGRMTINERKISTQNTCPTDFADCLHVARCIFNKARKIAQRHPLADDPGGSGGDSRAESCRWFMLPCEAQDLLLGRSQNVKQAVPFSPLHCRSPRGEVTDSPSLKPEPRLVPPSPTSLSQSLHQIFNPPKVQFVLGPTETHARQRCNSLGSALLRGRAGLGLALPYSRSLPDGEPLSDTNSEELQAYVTEVTRELATEIKSELREVISKTEQPSRPRLERTDSFTSASASDIAEYLMGVSREMAREMKCEIRELVSSVVTPDVSPMPEIKRTSDRVRREGISESRDSGINLSWSPELRKDYGRSESFDSVDVRELPKRKTSRTSKKWQEDSSSTASTTSEESNDEILQPLARWQCPPKAIWKPVLEAVDELRMINDGDSVLVNLLCDNSAPLLHTLHQLQLHSSSKGVHFSLAALTPTQEDPLLQSLGISAVPVTTSHDGRSCGCGLRRGDLQALGTSHKFSVLALGDCFDDFAENFLLSVFHSGRLKTLKAHTCPAEQNIRVIRPFVYVRAKALEEFTVSRKLSIPVQPCRSCPPTNNFKERQRCRDLLASQEMFFPHLFTSLRSALHPLIGTKYSSVGYATDSDELSVNGLS